LSYATYREEMLRLHLFDQGEIELRKKLATRKKRMREEIYLLAVVDQGISGCQHNLYPIDDAVVLN